MTHRTGILAGGNWIIDHVKIIDTWPAQDALANIVGGSDGSGGSPYNVLVDLAKLGVPLPLAGVGLVGEDADGRKILEDCARYTIDAEGIQRTSAAPTSFTDVMTVQGSGRRTFFHARGANALLNGGHFDFTKSRARIFHLGYLLLLDGLDAPSTTHGTVAAEVLARAQEAGMKTSIDVVSEDSDRFPKIVLPALPYVDVCVMNEFEAGRVTGRKIRVGEILDYGELRLAMQASRGDAWGRSRGRRRGALPQRFKPPRRVGSREGLKRRSVRCHGDRGRGGRNTGGHSKSQEKQPSVKVQSSKPASWLFGPLI